MNNERKKNWRRNLKTVMDILSSKRFQKKVWVKGDSKKIVSSLEEEICTYYEDLNLSKDFEWARKEGFLSDSEIEILLPFHNKFTKYVDNLGDKVIYSNIQDIINTPEWEKIRQEAEKTLKRLNLDDRPSILENI